MGHAITLYLSSETHELLERERLKRGLDTKPITVAKIVEEYFRRKGMLKEKD